MSSNDTCVVTASELSELISADEWTDGATWSLRLQVCSSCSHDLVYGFSSSDLRFVVPGNADFDTVAVVDELNCVSAVAVLGDYPGCLCDGLDVRGTIAVTKTGDGISVYGTMTGLEPLTTGAIQVLTGGSCASKGGPGEPYFDVWTIANGAAYTVDSDGVGTASFEMGMFSLMDGNPVAGHVVVVNDESGNRVACGVLELTSVCDKNTCLEALNECTDEEPADVSFFDIEIGIGDCFHPPSPAPSLPPSPVPTPCEISEDFMCCNLWNPYVRTQEEVFVNSMEVCAVAGSELSELTSLEEWSDGMAWSLRMQVSSQCSHDLMFGFSSSDLMFVVPGEASYSTVAVLDKLSCVSAVAVLGKYPGYSGSLVVGGTIAVSETDEGVSLNGILTGVERFTTGAVQILSGDSCAVANGPGEPYYAGSINPWTVADGAAYTADSDGIGMLSFEMGLFSLADENPVAGHVVAVNDENGNRVACGVLELASACEEPCLEAMSECTDDEPAEVVFSEIEIAFGDCFHPPSPAPTLPPSHLPSPLPSPAPTSQPTTPPTHGPTSCPVPMFPTFSASSCSELGWNMTAGKDDNVCGETDFTSGDDCSVMTWTDAVDYCAGFGARLCSVEELQNDETRGTGCGHDTNRIWTTTYSYDEDCNVCFEVARGSSNQAENEENASSANAEPEKTRLGRQPLSHASDPLGRRTRRRRRRLEDVPNNCYCVDVDSDFPNWNVFIAGSDLVTFDVDVLGSLSVCGSMDVSNYGVGENLEAYTESGDVSLRVCGEIVAENMLVYHGTSGFVDIDPGSDPEAIFRDGYTQITQADCDADCTDDEAAIVELSDKLLFYVEEDGCNTPAIDGGIMTFDPSTVEMHPAGYTLWCVQVRGAYQTSVQHIWRFFKTFLFVSLSFYRSCPSFSRLLIWTEQLPFMRSMSNHSTSTSTSSMSSTTVRARYIPMPCRCLFPLTKTSVLLCTCSRRCLHYSVHDF